MRKDFRAEPIVLILSSQGNCRRLWLAASLSYAWIFQSHRALARTRVAGRLYSCSQSCRERRAQPKSERFLSQIVSTYWDLMLCPFRLSIESLHSRYRLSCRDVLLCGILLHHVAPLPRRDPCLCANFEFHPSDATIPYKELPV